MTVRTLARDDFVLCSGTVRDLDIAATAQVAAATGYQGVSVYIHEVRDALARGWSLAALRRMLDDHGLGVAELDGQIDWTPRTDRRSRAASVDEAIEYAAALGARSMTALAMGAPGGALDLDEWQGAFGALCDAAAGERLLVHIEFFPFSLVADVGTALAITRGAGRANGGVLVDVWHHVRGPDGGSPDVLVDAAPWVLGIQVNDVVLVPGDDIRRECMHGRKLPGAGAGACAGIVSALRRGGCDAPIGVEVFSDDLDQLDPETAARTALEAAQGACG